MYSNEVFVVVIKNPNNFERYFLDYQTGQATVLPDVTSSIIQGLFPSLGKLGEFKAFIAPGAPADNCAAPAITATAIPPPAATHVADVLPAFRACMGQLGQSAIDVYHDLEPFVAPDALIPNPNTGNTTLNAIQSSINDFLRSEFAMSTRISAIANDSGLKASAVDAPAILELTNLQKLADAVATDLMGYKQRIADLDDFDNGADDCTNLLKVSNDDTSLCVAIASRRDDDRVYHNMVTRTITYALDFINVVSVSQETAIDPSKKKSIATLALNFADVPSSLSKKAIGSTLRWEASAGVFFSSLAVRSFSAAPVFTNAVITDKTVSQNLLRPTVVPFAAANYRLTDDLKWTRWKSALYLTGAVGINPNTTSADFAAGLSFSWRALMVGPLWHYGHDVSLTQGLHVGQSLGAGFSGNLSTQTSWTNSFAMGVAVRIPALTGR
jgi:hypothetical protein